MKKNILTTVFILLAIGVKAQTVTVLSSDFFEKKSFTLSAHVVDSVSNESLGFVSAYLRHTSDTLITNFALSDADGKVELNEVTTGNYILTVEYLGYTKFQKELYIRKDLDAGTIRLKPDYRVLDAATVSAAGKEVEYKRDTIIFNATLFKTGSNDNLAALLKRMPGVEISKDGSVTINGKAVDKITIEGKTFFMNDKSAALNNLPASIVDKIQIVDKDSDAAQITGIKDINKERVMDVQLKEEYKKGFFGNVKVAGGAALPSGQKDDFLESGKFLFNSSLMGSYYNEKDQLTVIGNARNVNENGNYTVVTYGGSGIAGFEREMLPSDGVHTTYGGGANLNTSRIKNVTTTVSAKYNEDNVSHRKYTDRTSFQTTQDQLFDKENALTSGKTRDASVNAELKNTNGKIVSFTFSPKFSFNNVNSNESTEGSSVLGEKLINVSSGSRLGEGRYINAGGDLNASFKFPDNPRRRVGINAEYAFDSGKGVEKIDRTVDYSSTGKVAQDIKYDKESHANSFGASIFYTEPLSESWSLHIRAESDFQGLVSNKDAFDAGVYSNTYSSYTNNRNQSHELSISGQHTKGNLRMSLGANGTMAQNKVTTTSNGISTQAGSGDWTFNASPYIMLSAMSKDNLVNYSFTSTGYVNMPSASKTTPAMSIASPTRFMVGNLHLKPYTQYIFSFSVSGSTPKKQSFSTYIFGNISNNALSNAIWYDSKSIMYNVPVNVKDPGYSASVQGSFNTPLTKDGKLKFSIFAYANIDATTSYQSNGVREEIDIKNFKYDEFMEAFWGSSDGDKFYSGQSGFQRSRTANYLFSVSPSLKLNLDRFYLSAEVRPRANIVRYSFDPKANINTLNVNYSLDASYETKHAFELSTDLSYNTYYGYRDVFNKSIFLWNFSVLKNIKAFTLGVSIEDILNQGRDRSSFWNDNYSQYTYTNSIGRHIMISFKYNFGKMNAAQSAAARSASIRMSM